MSLNDSTSSALEWALRIILASALVIHSILDITDLCTGAKSYLLKVDDSIPRWLLPAVGVLRALAAVALFSTDNKFVLAALAYSSMLWSGAVYFHVRRKHHPAATIPAALFVLLVFAITAMRTNVMVALVGTVGCSLLAIPLGWMLVTPATAEENAEYLENETYGPF